MAHGAGGVLFWLDDSPIPTVSFGGLIYIQKHVFMSNVRFECTQVYGEYIYSNRLGGTIEVD
jgi:hypothetical protein